jgi:hypothetical protein
MNNKNFLTLISTDKELKALFIGIVICGIALLTAAVTAGAWYF